ncbi:SET domain-containing protein-lysine N-methyltransferase, partial [bacterium]|nr:SET domain-containing protein-lysine N-methyltransferase [bacterium]
NPQVDHEYSADYPKGLSPSEKKEFIDKASWDGEVWSLAGDEGAYFNHSEDPNVVVVTGNDHPAEWKRIASRDIEAGEELTMDYSEIGHDVPGFHWFD